MGVRNDLSPLLPYPISDICTFVSPLIFSGVAISYAICHPSGFPMAPARDHQAGVGRGTAGHPTRIDV